MKYPAHREQKKTPIYVMVERGTYEKSRSQALVAKLNHISVSSSYNDIRRSNNSLSSYAVFVSADEESYCIDSNDYLVVSIIMFKHL